MPDEEGPRATGKGSSLVSFIKGFPRRQDMGVVEL
jgi:hypothetical protein